MVETVDFKQKKRLVGEDLAGKAWDKLTPLEKAQIWANKEAAAELRQGAADEYAAHLAEKVIGNKTLTPKEQSIWEKIVSAIKKLFGQMDDTAIADALVRARDNLQRGAQGEIATTEGERFSAEENNGENIRINENNPIPSQQENHPLYKGWEKRNTEINTSDYEPTDDFRRIQEESRRRSQEDIKNSWRSDEVDEILGARLARILRDQLVASGYNNRLADELLVGKNPKTAESESYGIHKNVSGKLFHDIFEIVRGYLPNGELVDLHDNYDGYVCYLSEDGTSGFAINQETGYIASAFNLGVRKGFLHSISDYIRKEGATYGDCYNSNRQPLREIYERAWGAKIAATMDFNEDYDTKYDIGKNHGNPPVAFVVIPEKGEGADIKEEHFGKDEYDEALAHTLQYVIEQPNETNEAEIRHSVEENEETMPLSSVRNDDGSYNFEKAMQVLGPVREMQRASQNHDVSEETQRLIDGLRFSVSQDVGKKTMVDFNKILDEKYPDMDKEQREGLMGSLNEICRRAGKDGQTAAKAGFHWFLKDNTILPDHSELVLDAMQTINNAKQANQSLRAKGEKDLLDVDYEHYDSPVAMMNALNKYKPKGRITNPDEMKTLRNKKVLPDGYTIYDVEDSEEGQKEMRQIFDSHIGDKRNIWCLLQKNLNTGELTPWSKQMWFDYYNRFGKKVAFKDGKLVAFFASNGGPTWWDLENKSYRGLPMEGEIPNDPLGRSAEYEYRLPIEEITSNTDTSWQENYVEGASELMNIHKGNKENGTYEKWDENGQLRERSNYKNNKLNGLSEEWYDNGQLRERSNYKNNKLNGLREIWDEDGAISSRTEYKDDKLNGLRECWERADEILVRDNWKEGKRDGVCEVWNKNDQLVVREHWKDDVLDGLYESWHDNGRLDTRGNYKDDWKDGLWEQWDKNGNLIKREIYDNRELVSVTDAEGNEIPRFSVSERELEERKEKLRNSESVELNWNKDAKFDVNNRDAAIDWAYNNLLNRYFVCKDTRDRIYMPKKRHNNKMFSHSIGYQPYWKSLVAIPKLIRNAIFIGEEQGRKLRKKYDSYRYYVCGLNIDGDPYTVKMTIGLKDGKIAYYDHFLTPIDKKELLGLIDQTVMPEGFTVNRGNNSPSDALGKVKDTQLISILQGNTQKNTENLQDNGEFNTSEGENNEESANNGEAEGRFSAEQEQAPTNEDLFAQAERIANNLERQREENMRFRAEYRRDSARDAYEHAVRSGLFQSVEALQDSQRSVFVAMKSILGEKRLHIEDIPDFMNAYTGENRLSSVNQAEMEIAARALFTPLLREVARLAPSRQAHTALVNYMMAKHGLERNVYMAERDAQREFADYQAKNPNGTKTLADFINEARQSFKSWASHHIPFYHAIIWKIHFYILLLSPW